VLFDIFPLFSGIVGILRSKSEETMRPEALERVKLVFTLFDVDGNGNLEQNDFDLMTGRVLAIATESSGAARNALADSFSNWWTVLRTELDANHDNKISFEEFTACVLSPERFDDAIARFANALAALGDPDGDGLIPRPLFMDLMIAIGFDRPNIDALFDAFQPNSDDQVAVPVWVEAIKEYYQPEAAGTAGDKLVTA
jgi:Ca2+-binding EF-hand superfamily protein